jgi:Sec-independent protein secretion pathway component TatC
MAVFPASVPLLGGILVLCAVVSVARVRLAFVGGGVLSLAIACIMAMYATILGVTLDIPLTLLSAATAVLSFLVSRRAREMPEQYNPMNLPVFG